MAQIRHMMQIRDMIVLKSNPSEYYTQTFTKKMIQELSLIRGFWFLESHPKHVTPKQLWVFLYWYLGLSL